MVKHFLLSTMLFTQTLFATPSSWDAFERRDPPLARQASGISHHLAPEASISKIVVALDFEVVRETLNLLRKGPEPGKYLCFQEAGKYLIIAVSAAEPRRQAPGPTAWWAGCERPPASPAPQPSRYEEFKEAIQKQYQAKFSQVDLIFTGKGEGAPPMVFFVMAAL